MSNVKAVYNVVPFATRGLSIYIMNEHQDVPAKGMHFQGMVRCAGLDTLGMHWLIIPITLRHS